MRTTAVNNDCEAFGYRVGMEQMGDRIKRLREARGMTQTELGKRCGVTPQAVSRWESGLTENIQLPTFLSLTKVLDTDPEYLVYGPTRTAPHSRLRNNHD